MGILDDEGAGPRSRQINFRCPSEVLARLDRLSKASSKKRSKVIVRLLLFALPQAEDELARHVGNTRRKP